MPESTPGGIRLSTKVAEPAARSADHPVHDPLASTGGARVLRERSNGLRALLSNLEHPLAHYGKPRRPVVGASGQTKASVEIPVERDQAGTHVALGEVPDLASKSFGFPVGELDREPRL
jgi:hypothetical protein